MTTMYQVCAAPILVALLLTGCEKETEAPKDKAAEQVQVDPNIVTASDDVAQRLKTATVGMKDIRETLRIPGTIEVDEQRVSRIGASVTGRITDIDVTLGQAVKQGQSLATLNSTELAQNQLSFIKAMQQIALQTKAVERAKLLLNADVIGSAELQKREADLAAAKADLNAAQDQLLILGMSKQAVAELAKTNRIHSFSSVTARIGGTIIERKVNLGQVVQPADELFMVADLSHVWAVASVPEQQIDLIKNGEDVAIEVPALNHNQYKAKLIYVGDVVDPDSRTVLVRTDLDNKDKQIKPAMLVSMLIESVPVPRLAISEQAIVREEDKDYVYVQLEKNKYRLRPVTLGNAYDGFRPVLSGLTEGEVIVSEGAFHLNNERKRKELE